MNQKNKSNQQYPVQAATLQEATGKISYNMLNDYMFRIVMQNNPEALKNIIAAVLHIPPARIVSLEVTNAIIPGEAISNKEFRMDVSVCFNDNTYVDIELQVRDQTDWTFRSLHYLCREYEEGLSRGEAYIVNHAAYQIGFLDYTLFPDHVKFFSAYEMCDIDDGYKFNSNFALFVIDLSQIDIATEADKATGLDKWCRLFKADSWDELKKLAKEDKLMEMIAEEVFKSNSDYAVRKRCQDREDYLRWKKWQETEFEKAQATIAAQEKALAEQDKIIMDKDKTIMAKDKEIEHLKALLNENS